MTGTDGRACLGLNQAGSIACCMKYIIYMLVLMECHEIYEWKVV